MPDFDTFFHYYIVFFKQRNMRKNIFIIDNKGSLTTCSFQTCIYSCVSLKSCYKLNLFSRFLTEASSGNKCKYFVNMLSRTKNYSFKI